MSAEPEPILIASIYMPFYDSSKRVECMAETSETIAMLDAIISDHPSHRILIGGDFNTELKNNSPFDTLWREFIRHHDLVSCDQYNNNNNNNNNVFTYIHNSLDQRKWNDHFLVSSSLAPLTDEHEIMDVGDNPSDHLPITLRLSITTTSGPTSNDQPKRASSLKWEKCSEEQKSAYRNRLNDLLYQEASNITDCNTVHCRRPQCIESIQREYDHITESITTADKILPRHKPGVQKHWWTEELTALRNQSIEIHRLWQTEGKPRSGQTNAERLRVRAAYRHAIKAAQRAPKQTCWNRVHGAFVSKNTTEFWSSWKRMYSKNKSDLHTVVDGKTTKNEIAESFRGHFVKVSLPNSQERVHLMDRDFRDKYSETLENHTNCSCATHNVTLEGVLDATFKLKKGKCSDDAHVSAEHFFNAPLVLFDRLQLLFDKMLIHSFVPHQFQRGTIIPLVKDSRGDKSDMNNYRGITIAPVISMLCKVYFNNTFLHRSIN